VAPGLRNLGGEDVEDVDVDGDDTNKGARSRVAWLPHVSSVTNLLLVVTRKKANVMRLQKTTNSLAEF
jgi:hypothetical protein